MTEAELQAIEARANAATPAPWGRRDQIIGQDKYHASTEVFGNPVIWHGKQVGSTPICKLSSGFVWFEGDCEFISHARQDVSALIDELRRYKRAIDSLPMSIQDEVIEALARA
jgi:hypothetical protein